MGEALHIVPSATRAQRVKAVEQTKMAKPTTLTQGVATTSEFQSDLGKILRIAHTKAAPRMPLQAFETTFPLVLLRGPREAL
jgi:hypothetical protein